ncbi:hypothetical protein RLOC_00001888 [Lonchura striata]|uniref:Secreted protein n=1 Tax=Lonchura striata TaxID=40157 RepID=A0A218UMG8_9PASE|nr:hypothetical protein RLOC_00001888 [Lonchura striata domestica]
MNTFAPQLLVALVVQICDSTANTSEEVDAFWKQCQEEHHLNTNPSRCSIPALPCLPCLQGRRQRSQHDLGFALHTGLQCRL